MKALTWLAVARLLATQPPGSKLRLRRSLTQHPKDGGLVRTLGLPVGQRADYRLDWGGDQILYVQDFSTHLEARLEPRLRHVTSAVRRTAADGDDASAMLGGAAAGALLGLLLGRSSSSAATGLLLGAIAGLVAGTAESAPQASSQMVQTTAAAKLVSTNGAQSGRVAPVPATAPLSGTLRVAGRPQVAATGVARPALSDSNPLKRALSEKRKAAGTPQAVGKQSAGVAKVSKLALSETPTSPSTIEVVRKDLTKKSHPQDPWPPGKKGRKA